MNKRIVKTNGANGKMPVNWIAEGVKAGLVTLSADNKRITYRHHNISRDFTKPEAPVEAELMEAK